VIPPARAVQCADCRTQGIPTLRPTPHPGPRCVTHHRAFRRAQKDRQHDKYVGRVYGLPPGKYRQLYEAQGGLCGICGPWTGRSGKTKRLATDHDHLCCPGPTSCGECVRGLLCGICNDFLGKIGDRPQVFSAGIAYLADPPARRVLGEDAA
jgi:hypothetical protein